MIEKFLQLISTPLYASVESELGGTGKYYQKIIPLSNSSYSLGGLIEEIINILLWVVGVAAVIYLIWAGISYITAAGDDAKAAKARMGIINAVIGIVVVLLAFVIQGAVGRIFSGGGSNTNTVNPPSTSTRGSLP